MDHSLPCQYVNPKYRHSKDDYQGDEGVIKGPHINVTLYSNCNMKNLPIFHEHFKAIALVTISLQDNFPLSKNKIKNS